MDVAVNIGGTSDWRIDGVVQLSQEDSGLSRIGANRRLRLSISGKRERAGSYDEEHQRRETTPHEREFKSNVGGMQRWVELQSAKGLGPDKRGYCPSEIRSKLLVHCAALSRFLQRKNDFCGHHSQ